MGYSNYMKKYKSKVDLNTLEKRMRHLSKNIGVKIKIHRLNLNIEDKKNADKRKSDLHRDNSSFYTNPKYVNDSKIAKDKFAYIKKTNVNVFSDSIIDHSKDIIRKTSDKREQLSTTSNKYVNTPASKNNIDKINVPEYLNTYSNTTITATTLSNNSKKMNKQNLLVPSHIPSQSIIEIKKSLSEETLLDINNKSDSTTIKIPTKKKLNTEKIHEKSNVLINKRHKIITPIIQKSKNVCDDEVKLPTPSFFSINLNASVPSKSTLNPIGNIDLPSTLKGKVTVLRIHDDEHVKMPTSIPIWFDFKRFQNKLHALNDVFESEMLYFRDITYWGNSVKDNILSNDKISFKKRTQLVQAIFSRIKPIIDLHTSILECIVVVNQSIWPRKLKDRYQPYDLEKISNMHFTEAINDLPSIIMLNRLSYTNVYLKHITKFNCYIDYVINLPRAEYELIYEYDNNPHFKKTIIDTLKNSSRDKSLKYYLNRPIQKLSTYSSLFKVFFKDEMSFIRHQDVKLLRDKIIKIWDKMNNMLSETIKFFHIFKLNKEIKYDTKLKRLYPLSLYFKDQRVLREGFFDIILNKKDAINIDNISEKRYLIILSNLIVICECDNDNNSNKKIIITKPYHLAITNTFQRDIEVDYLKYLNEKRRKNTYFLHLVEKNRDEIATICFYSSNSRKQVRSIINDATREYIRYNIHGIKLVTFQSDIKDKTGIFLSRKYVLASEVYDFGYNDNFLHYDQITEHLDESIWDFTEEISSLNHSIIRNEKCCMSINNRNNIDFGIENSEFSLFQKIKEDDIKSSVKKPPRLCNKNRITDHINAFNKYQFPNYDILSKIQFSVINGKYYQESQSILNKINNHKNKNKVITLAEETITTYSNYKRQVTINLESKYEMTRKISLCSKKQYNTPIETKFGQNRNFLMTKYLTYKICENKTLCYDRMCKNCNSNLSKLAIKNKNLSYGCHRNVYQGVDSQEILNKFEVKVVHGLKSLPEITLSEFLFSYAFISRKIGFTISMPTILPSKSDPKIYNLIRKNIDYNFNGCVDNIIYDNLSNIIIYLFKNKLYYGFFNTEKPIVYKKIKELAEKFYYHKKTNTLVVVEKSDHEIPCLLVYKLVLYENGVKLMNENKISYDNRIDFDNTYIVRTIYGPKKINELKTHYSTNLEIKAKLLTNIYVRSHINCVYFSNGSILVASDIFQLINLNTLIAEDIISSRDELIQYYVEYSVSPKPVKMLQYNEQTYFLVYDKMGFFIDQSGKIITEKKVFTWIFIVNDGRLMSQIDIKNNLNINLDDDWICLLSDHAIEIWSLRSGKLMHIEYIENLKFIRNTKQISFCNDKYSFCFCKIK